MKRKRTELDNFILSHQICLEETKNGMNGAKFIILQNEIKCKLCGDQIFSRNRHDYVRCKCGKVAVDGGMDYLKRSGNMDDFEDLNIILKKNTVTKCLDIIYDSLFVKKRNQLGILCAIMRTLRDEGEL